VSDLTQELKLWLYIRDQEAIEELAAHGPSDELTAKNKRTSLLRNAIMYLRDLVDTYYVDLTEPEFNSLITKLYHAKDLAGNYVLIKIDEHIGCDCHYTIPQITIGPATFRCPDATQPIRLVAVDPRK